MLNTIFDTKTVKNNELDLNTEEKKARLTIIEEMARQDGAIDLKYIDLNMEIINSLSEKGMIVLDENKKKVIFAYPVSGEHTSHEIHLADGRVFHSMCAIDSLGSSFTFGQDLIIKSKCSTSGDPLEIAIKDKQIESTNVDDIYVIHVDLNEEKDWFSSCWNDMNFFRGKENLEEYYNSRNLDPSTSFALTLEEGFKIGELIFSVDKTLDQY